jgi:group I intron endonuclease
MGFIYKIVNLINTKKYVGSTQSKCNLRWNCHKSTLRRNLHGNRYLQNSWNKYGERNFQFEIVEEIKDSTNEQLIEKETVWKNTLKAEYNIAPIDRPLGTINLGRKLTKEHIEKIRRGNLGKKLTEQHKQAISLANTGIKNGMYGKTREKNTKFAGCFVWEHLQYGKETLSQMEMVKKYGLIAGNLYRVVVGQRHNHHGWKCMGKAS